MAARGSVAKTTVENKIAMCFGNDFIGNVGGKLYVWANDGGERVQIALAMTCPKTMVDAPTEDKTDWDFDSMETTFEKPAEFKPAEITDEEKKNIELMMERLGL